MSTTSIVTGRVDVVLWLRTTGVVEVLRMKSGCKPVGLTVRVAGAWVYPELALALTLKL